MPVFMDIHRPVTIDDVAKTHAADLPTQPDHDVHHLRYGSTKITARSSASSTRLTPRPRTPRNRQAHGLVADEIFPVQESI